jgi:hypothetical protein
MKVFNLKISTILALLIITLLLSKTSLAEPTFSASSGKTQIALLELYTSEGCSSCPPAEKLLGELEDRGLPSSAVIPLALHVDYWDYIGWKDEFAKPAHTKRQRRLGKINDLNTIYTPQFLLNGKDLRPVGLIAHRLPSINQQIAEIKIDLSASYTANDTLKVRWKIEPALPASCRIFLVVTESNLQTEIGAGENQGRTLNHDHVVRSMNQSAANSPNDFVSIPIAAELKRNNLDLIAFVEDKNGRVLQTLKLPLH